MRLIKILTFYIWFKCLGNVPTGSLVNGTLTLSWRNVFLCSETMLYEVTVGTETGAGDVLLGFETYDTSITISSHKFHSTEQVFVHLVAIAPQGLYETVRETLHMHTVIY